MCMPIEPVDALTPYIFKQEMLSSHNFSEVTVLYARMTKGHVGNVGLPFSEEKTLHSEKTGLGSSGNNNTNHASIDLPT